jgi:tRNA-dihydrouridine synthase B
MRIGDIELHHGLLLAPIAGSSKIPFRLLARRWGCDLAFTEMIKAQGLLRSEKSVSTLIARDPEEGPVGAQIAGRDPARMAEAACILVERHGFALIDINMGCPVPKVMRQGIGGALMGEPKLAGKILRSVVKATRRPVVLKIRSGLNEDRKNAAEIACRAEQAGIAAITVHGRTCEQRYRGRVNLEDIRRVAAAVHIPVIGNGDITTPERAREMLDRTCCDGLMIGRGAFGSPWIFRDCAHYFATGEIPPPPSPKEIGDMLLWHHAETIHLMGEYRGNRLMRKYACWYFSGFPGAKSFRRNIHRCARSHEFIALIRDRIREVSHPVSISP